MSVRRYTPEGNPVLTEDHAAPRGGVRYAKSQARRRDEALKRGGELAVIAKQLGTTPGQLRLHIKSRVASGRWTWTATDGEVRQERGKWGRFVATAGRLEEVK